MVESLVIFSRLVSVTDKEWKVARGLGRMLIDGSLTPSKIIDAIAQAREMVKVMGVGEYSKEIQR
ncbi:hypothetical protein [Ferrimicrobium acidiphilum]|uniref:Uncharacterized protein n=1 Tax=Ferrimicrobium acidiphilum TaxID=121039 RepID=A0ABV3Y479_9ACTN